MTEWLIIACLVGAGIVGGAFYLMRFRREVPPSWMTELIEQCRSNPNRRASALEQWLAQSPRNPKQRAFARILLGCDWLDRGYPERAVRPFQLAYHAAPDYAAAMVLAFACMKINSQTASQTLEKIAETWKELRTPPIGRTRRERVLLKACRDVDPPGQLSSLGIVLWSLPSESLRSQIREAERLRPPWAAPFLKPSRTNTHEATDKTPSPR